MKEMGPQGQGAINKIGAEIGRRLDKFMGKEPGESRSIKEFGRFVKENGGVAGVDLCWRGVEENGKQVLRLVTTFTSKTPEGNETYRKIHQTVKGQDEMSKVKKDVLPESALAHTLDEIVFLREKMGVDVQLEGKLEKIGEKGIKRRVEALSKNNNAVDPFGKWFLETIYNSKI